MIHSGEGTTNGIRCRFNPSTGINSQGAKIGSDTAILLLREIDGRLGSLPPLKEFFKIQGSCQTPDTGGLTFSVNVSIKSQQAMKTAMTPMSFAGIRPFV